MPTIDIVFAVTAAALGGMYAYRRRGGPTSQSRSVSDYERSLQVLGGVTKGRPTAVVDLTKDKDDEPPGEAIDGVSEGLLHPVPPLRPKRPSAPEVAGGDRRRAERPGPVVPLERPSVPTRLSSSPSSPLPPGEGTAEPAAAWAATDGRTVSGVAPRPEALEPSPPKGVESPLAPLAAQLRDAARESAFAPPAQTSDAGVSPSAAALQQEASALQQEAGALQQEASPGPGPETVNEDAGQAVAGSDFQVDLRDGVRAAQAPEARRAAAADPNGGSGNAAAVLPAATGDEEAEETAIFADSLAGAEDPAYADAGAGVLERVPARPQVPARPLQGDRVSAGRGAVSLAATYPERQERSSLWDQLRAPSVLVPAAVAIVAVSVTAVVVSQPVPRSHPRVANQPTRVQPSHATVALKASSNAAGTLAYSVGTGTFAVVMKDTGSGPCWVEELPSPTGAVAWEGTLYPGQVRVLASIGGSLWVRAGDPVNLSMSVGGRPVSFSAAGGVPLNFYFRP